MNSIRGAFKLGHGIGLVLAGCRLMSYIESEA
jgi:hypothetical protein